MKQIVYRYKLCKDHTVDNAQIAGISLSKTFKDFPTKQYHFEAFLRTNTNLDGFLDFEEKDLISGIVVDKSLFEGPKKKYNPVELTFFNREQLVEIAQSYNIDPRNKRNDFLIQLIIIEQEKIKKFKKEKKQKEETNERINNEISEE